jgi:hypothetical protein
LERAQAQGALIHELWTATALVRHLGEAGGRDALRGLLDRIGDGAPPADVEAARSALS